MHIMIIDLLQVGNNLVPSVPDFSCSHFRNHSPFTCLWKTTSNMGATQSSQSPAEQVISAPGPSTSVQVSPPSYLHNLPSDVSQFSPSLISRLSSPPDKPNTSNTPDDIVRRRLAAESAHLRSQEAEILSSISAALEKENLDREKPGMSSEVLGRDIEEVREKVERMGSGRREKESEGVRRAKEGVVRCYL